MKANVALLSLLGSIVSAATAVTPDAKEDVALEVVPGAYIVEFQDNHVGLICFSAQTHDGCPALLTTLYEGFRDILWRPECRKC